MSTAQEVAATIDNVTEDTTKGANGKRDSTASGVGNSASTPPASSDTAAAPTTQQADQKVATLDKVASSSGNGLDIKDVIKQVMLSLGGAIAPQQPARPRPSKWLDDPTVRAINNAFMLGWSIVELRSRLQIASDLAPAPFAAKLEREFDNPLQFTSQWRALFTRIATMQMAAFGDVSTRDTFYQPAKGWFFLLPYLDQQPGDTSGATPYFDIGLPTTSYPGLLTDSAMHAFGDFSLYQVTRRALNCVALLHIKEDANEPLLSASLCSYTDPLFAALDMPLPAGISAGDEQAAREQRRVDAIVKVTTHIVQLLDAWNGFLRENYYSGGAIMNDSTEQTAYRAGSSLAALSWNLTQETATMQLDTPPTSDQLVQLHKAWSTAFAEGTIVNIQHQLAALATVLDDAYYRLAGTAKPAASDGAAAVFDPDLPSEVLSCLSHSLDFWQKAVGWLDPQPTTPPQDPQNAHPLTADLAESLHAALVEQSAMWQDLITGQQTMSAYGVETVMHAVINDLFDKFKQDIQKSLQQTTRGALEETLRRVVIPLGLAILVMSIPAIVWLAIAQPHLSNDLSANGLWAVLGLGPAIGGILSIRNLGSTGRGGTAPTTNVTTSASASTPSASTAPSGQNATPGSYLQGMMSNVSATVIEMLQAAMKQVRLDLAALNHEVGITYPLLECFVRSNLESLKNISQDYTFMTQVIWSGTERQQEIENVVRAAFGPLGILIKTQVEQDKPSATGT